MTKNTIEKTIKLLESLIDENSKKLYVSLTLYDNLMELGKIKDNCYTKDGIKTPVIAESIAIGEEKSKEHQLEDLGEKSFIIEN